MTQTEWKSFLRFVKEKGKYCEVVRRINEFIDIGYDFAKTLPDFINDFSCSTLKAAFKI